LTFCILIPCLLYSIAWNRGFERAEEALAQANDLRLLARRAEANYVYEFRRAIQVVLRDHSTVARNDEVQLEPVWGVLGETIAQLAMRLQVSIDQEIHRNDQVIPGPVLDSSILFTFDSDTGAPKSEPGTASAPTPSLSAQAESSAMGAAYSAASSSGPARIKQEPMVRVCLCISFLFILLLTDS